MLGAQLGGARDLGWREKLAVQFRLGWSHEYADTGRPVTATFAAVSTYLHYEGDISGQDSAHAIADGVRMTW